MTKQTVVLGSGRGRAFTAATLGFLAVSCCLLGASAAATVSATVLGPAETDIASGAVSLSNISDPVSGRIVVAPAARPAPLAGAQVLSTFRIAGGHSATYSVVLPAVVKVTNGEAELCLSRFSPARPAGRLAADGSATLRVIAVVAITGEQPAGAGAAGYQVTIAFD
jgi:hypothetical protein